MVQEIPVFDYEDLVSPEPSILQQLRWTCHHTGFFYLRYPELANDLLNTMFHRGKDFLRCQHPKRMPFTCATPDIPGVIHYSMRRRPRELLITRRPSILDRGVLLQIPTRATTFFRARTNGLHTSRNFGRQVSSIWSNSASSEKILSGVSLFASESKKTRSPVTLPLPTAGVSS